MSDDGYRIEGTNAAADFTLTAHRGDGMVMLAMNWRVGEPPDNFVGWQIHCVPPGWQNGYFLFNQLRFPALPGLVAGVKSDLAPFQRFRWVDFPEDTDATGAYRYTVTPAFMDAGNAITPGTAQTVDIVLRRETYPGVLDVAYTRGFLSSQAYVRHFGGLTGKVLPSSRDNPLTFQTASDDALTWMTFEAGGAILGTLKAAQLDPTATVRVVAYDLNEPHIIDALVALGNRLKIVIDKSGSHGKAASPENAAAVRLIASAGNANVAREKLGGLQHNKTIVVDGPTLKRVVCGSTNFSWRGLYVQNNNAITLEGADAVAAFGLAFDRYFVAGDTTKLFAATDSTGWRTLALPGVDARVTFSPHSSADAVLKAVGADIASAKSSVFYSLAFLYQFKRGPIVEALKAVTASERFVYGMSDHAVGGFDLHKPDGNVAPVSPASLGKFAPPGFKQEPTRGGGVQLHHKFVVIDPDTPDARVYVGSFNFSRPADVSNGENLLLIRDRRVATSFLVEALSMFDHYSFRDRYQDAPLAGQPGRVPPALLPPPRDAGDVPWWKVYYQPGSKQRDRQIFA